MATKGSSANTALDCVKCGKEVSEMDAFCIYCGTKVSLTLAQKLKKQEPAAPPAKAKEPEPSPAKDRKVSQKVPEAAKPAAPQSNGSAKSAPVPAPAPAKAAKTATPPTSSTKTVTPPASKNGKTEAVPASRPPPSKNGSASEKQPASNAKPLPVTVKAAAEETKAPPKSSQPPTSQGSYSAAEQSGSYSRDRDSLDAGPSSEIQGMDQLWVPNDFSNECMDCKTPFGFPKPRRHHCRVCGLLFCRPCVNSKVQVPTSFGYGNNAQRCCRSCVTALQMNTITSPSDVFAQRKGVPNKSSKSLERGASHYEVLNVEQNASQEEIAKSFKSISRNLDPSTDKDKLQQVEQAYRALQDPASRRRHDSEIQSADKSSYDEGHNGSFIAAKSDQTECQVCFRPFKLGRRQHHCRRCTRSVCNSCSDDTQSIPELGFPNKVKHCRNCQTNPPKFIYPVMEPVAKPPPGFEYLAKLDVCIKVNATGDDAFVVTTYCEPNKEALKANNAMLTENDKAVANEYAIKLNRSTGDFEWLFQAYGSVTNVKALPYFPSRSDRSERPQMYRTFLYGCLIHPYLRDADCLKAFLSLPTDELSSFKQNGWSNQLYKTEKYKPVISVLRLEFERAQMREKVDELIARERASKERLEKQKIRYSAQAQREKAQEVRREQAKTRDTNLHSRKQTQIDRMERENDRAKKQIAAPNVLFFDTVRDENQRDEEEANRSKDKVEFTKSKDSFKADTTNWNQAMSEWSKHRAAWSEAHHPTVSKQVANEWILKSYGVYHSSESVGKMDDVPRELINLHNKLTKLQESEPALLEEEGEEVDDEWMKLAREREHWSSDRALMKKEDELIKDEDVRYKQEHDYVEQNADARKKKEQAIENDLLALSIEVKARQRSIDQRRLRQTAFANEFDNEWEPIQGQRGESTKARLAEHNARISRATKRNETFTDQLSRQQKSSRMLLFKRAAMAEERKKDLKVFEDHQEDLKNALEEAQNAILIAPEYTSRLQSDMGIRAEEIAAVKASNKRTTEEGGDNDIDERDPFMNDVRKRREAFQKELNEQAAQLEKEQTLCTALLSKIDGYVKKLNQEVADANQEKTHVEEFKTLLDQESNVLKQEEVIREQKKNEITKAMNNAGNWVLDALHTHSKRKKAEANRLVKQAYRAADLQKLVQHFTHRVIEQEERIMIQKQRILNGEHKVEMLKSTETWFQYVTGPTPDMGKKDLKMLDAGCVERVEDLKQASKLQKDDEADVKSVNAELAVSKTFATEKESKREVWAKLEDIYSSKKPQEKDEDMMMTSQIRSLLQQLGEAFEMLQNRLIEEDESLRHASLQLESEIESINAFMQRMETEESALCQTERASLEKEQQVRRNEEELVEKRARSLLDQYKQMQQEHAKYPMNLAKQQGIRSQRGAAALPRDAELEAAKKVLKNPNFYDRRSCSEFAKKFKIDKDMASTRDVFEYLKTVMELDIKKSETWLEESRKDRKAMEDVKLKAKEVDWSQDTLAKIPALKEVQRKLQKQTSGPTKGGSTTDSILPSEQWIVDLIACKKTISELDATLLVDVTKALESARNEEKVVATNLKKMKTDKEFVLNTLRVVDQEEAKAVRLGGKGALNGQSSLIDKTDNGTASPKQQVQQPAAANPAVNGSARRNQPVAARGNHRQGSRV